MHARPAALLLPPLGAFAVALVPRPEVPVVALLVGAAVAFEEWWPVIALGAVPAVVVASLAFDPASSAKYASHLESAAAGLNVGLLVLAVVVAVVAAAPFCQALVTLDLPGARAGLLRAAPLPALLLLKSLAEGRPDVMAAEFYEQATVYRRLLWDWLVFFRDSAFGKRVDKDARMRKRS